MEKLTLSLADAERRLESEDKDKELVATKVSNSIVCMHSSIIERSINNDACVCVSLVRTR